MKSTVETKKKKQKTSEEEIQSLKASNIILQHHLAYVRSRLIINETKLKRNEKMLRLCTDALTQNVPVHIEAFSLN